VQFGVTICIPAPMEPIERGQVMGPAGELVAREMALPFPPPELDPPMPGMPAEDEVGAVVIDGMVPAPLEAPGEPFIAGMALPEAPVEPFIGGMALPACAEEALGIDDIDPDGVAD